LRQRDSINTPSLVTVFDRMAGPNALTNSFNSDYPSYAFERHFVISKNNRAVVIRVRSEEFFLSASTSVSNYQLPRMGFRFKTLAYGVNNDLPCCPFDSTLCPYLGLYLALRPRSPIYRWSSAPSVSIEVPLPSRPATATDALWHLVKNTAQEPM
jgi:hypothetical protein